MGKSRKGKKGEGGMEKERGSGGKTQITSKNCNFTKFSTLGVPVSTLTLHHGPASVGP